MGGLGGGLTFTSLSWRSNHIVTTNNYKEGVWRRYPSQGGAVIPWSVFGDLPFVGKSLPEAIGEIIAGRENTVV
jgi:hypothetical protein